jgi:hypothetical protein
MGSDLKQTRMGRPKTSDEVAEGVGKSSVCSPREPFQCRSLQLRVPKSYSLANNIYKKKKKKIIIIIIIIIIKNFGCMHTKSNIAIN